MPSVRKRPQAMLDLADLAYYLAQRDSAAVGERFLVLAETTFGDLAGQPHRGGLWQATSSAWAGLRVWPIRGFKNHVIFYRPIEGGIEVVRILHGTRDLESLFGSDPP